MVLLTTTPTIHHALLSLPDTSLLPSPFTTAPAIGEPIDHTTLIALSRLSSINQTLSNLLRGTSVYIPPPPPRPTPSPEYLALKRSLLEAQDRRAYASLINKDVSSVAGETADSEADNGHDDIPPTLVLNILLSIILCAAATFQLTRWVLRTDGIRVLASLLVGVVVGVAEVGVYAGYLRKVDRARRLERGKREIKSVIGVYTGVEEGEGRAVGLTREDGKEDKEEIWGRGMNGGMRRRVREKWERGQEKEKEQEGETEKGK